MMDHKPEKKQNSQKKSPKKNISSENITLSLNEYNELKKKIEDLEREKLEIQQANTLKSQFLASMSHEIRSPLNAIFNYIRFLKKMYYKDHDFLFDNLELCTNHIMETLRKLIDISRLHNKQFPYQPEICNIPKILTDTILTIEILALKKGLAITQNCESADIYSNVDPYAISHAFLNIIDNAIKYTETEKGHIIISLNTDKKGNIIIEFTDKGVGINDEHIPFLFDEFANEIGSFNRRSDGTGIGMPLTKRFVEACNGTISVKSLKNEGTIVTIILPEFKQNKSFKKAYEEIKHPEAPNIDGLNNILIAENDAFNQQFLQMNLKKEYYNIHKAMTTDQIFSILKNYKIDTIILDIGMFNDKDLAKLKRGKQTKDIPIICLTESENIKSKKEIIDLFNSFVIKPVNIQELSKRIQEQIKNKQ